jgi:hypothetical protein
MKSETAPNNIDNGKMSPTDWTKIWHDQVHNFSNRVDKLLDVMALATHYFEKLEKEFTKPDLKSMAREEVENCDLALARSFSTMTVHVRLRAERSENVDLLSDSIGGALSLCEQIPNLIEKFARLHPDEFTDSENFMARFAEVVCNLTERLEKFTETHPNALRPMAGDYPYWPMLHFKSSTANNHFPLLADRIKLGETCVIHTSEQARYSLKVPLNKFVWRLLLHFQDIHRLADYADDSKRPLEDVLSVWIKTSDPNERIDLEELPVYKKSHRLSPLTKANAKAWAEVALLPFIRMKYPDLRKVPEFKSIDTGPKGKRYAPIRKAIIQSLRSLARN